LTDLKGDDPDFIRTVIVNNQDISTNNFHVLLYCKYIKTISCIYCSLWYSEYVWLD